MADKYIRVSNKLHERLKVLSATLHISLRFLVEGYLLDILAKDEYLVLKKLIK